VILKLYGSERFEVKVRSSFMFVSQYATNICLDLTCRDGLSSRRSAYFVLYWAV